MDELAKWRRQIDEIDAQLVEHLNKRAASAVEIGKIKRKQKMDNYNPEREKNIIQRICQLNKGPLDDDAIQRIFQQIIEECRNIENI